jgi:hypothetical protein
MASISRYLERKLKVKVNQAKSKVRPVKESSVLGFEIHHKKLRTLDCKIRKFKHELKLITRRCPGWRLSKTLGTNMGLSNAHFEEIGLISLRTLWCKIHHPATAR